MQQRLQVTDGKLMLERWCRRHEQLPVDDFVPVAIVRDRLDQRGRPIVSRVRHTHTIISSAAVRQESISEDCLLRSRQRHRASAMGVIATPECVRGWGGDYPQGLHRRSTYREGGRGSGTG